MVEDNIEAAWLVQSWLEWTEVERFHLEWTRNLEEAIKRLAEPGIDVILLDLGLPELNGYKSFQAVDAASRSRIPVVILTSDENPISKDLTMGFGASDYLFKSKTSMIPQRQAILNAICMGRQRPNEEID
jgi:DNA-binding response OmpR family regulator